MINCDSDCPGATPPTRVNRLIHSSSPYLLQHAHNPVDWHEWGQEALETAKREARPIFLSIGYSACHWCHVMERESFENEPIARVMNDNYVCIKVDREERPDLDAIYMSATQAMTGRGGWPMSVWLTPDLKPFYAGTYFPPEGRGGRPGFKEVLRFLADTWREERSKILGQADRLAAAVQQALMVNPATQTVPADIVTRTAVQLGRAFDPIKGGIAGGGANKFPPCMAMDLMLRAHHHSRFAERSAAAEGKMLLGLVELTLEKMAHGGIYDHLGGGIARYSTGADWLVPHFEKMLYDQALVADIYLKAFQVTGKPLYARVAGGVLNYVMADLQSPEGGFYSARDADSEGREGKFYIWSKAEVIEALGAEDAVIFCDYYDVTEAGNWEGRNILNIPRSIEVVAKLHHLPVDELLRRLDSARERLREVRERREKPLLDDKVLASWNGLMIAAMARGHRILGEDKYRQSAAGAADFVVHKMVKDGRLLRAYRRGQARIPAYLDDYACTIEGLLNLYEATFEIKWLDHAAALNDRVMELFRDDSEGGFFYTADDAEKLLVRIKDSDDAAAPSGNSVQLSNLLRLAILFDRQDLREEAERLLRAFSGRLSENPFRSERMVAAIDFYHRGPRELVFVAPANDAAGLDALVNAAWQTYSPNAVVAGLQLDAADAADVVKKIPLLSAKVALNGKATAYVCKDHACRTPTSDPEEVRHQLSRP